METYIVKKKDKKLLLFKEDKEIGQVSPNATWVKEGDEFTEEECEWQDTPKYHSCILIQCPTCKTFH